MTLAYWMEKVEAYNVAISALDMHEPGSDGDKKLARKFREVLAAQLNFEINKWILKNPKPEGIYP